jgi:hypothetical protein
LIFFLRFNKLNHIEASCSSRLLGLTFRIIKFQASIKGGAKAQDEMFKRSSKARHFMHSSLMISKNAGHEMEEKSIP